MKSHLMELFDEICAALQRIRIIQVDYEYDLQAKIAQQLEGAHIPFQKEYRLAKGNRLDFFVDGIAIEVKKGKPNRTKVLEQIKRYADFDCVMAVVVVVQSSLQVPIKSINGKPCLVIGLQKLWGIAL